MNDVPATVGKNPKRPGKPPGTATRLTRMRANELYAAGDDGLSVMVDNMKFWRDKALMLGQVMEEQLGRIKDLKDAEAVAVALAEFNKTSSFFLAARERAHACAVDVAPYTNPRLQAITIKKTSVHTEIHMTLPPAADDAERKYRNAGTAGGTVVPIKRTGT